MMLTFSCLLITILATDDPAPPVEDGPWIRPADSDLAEPIWGHRDGLRIGLWPTPGPRGLLRIYAPYLDQPRLRVINFIAVEPIVTRGRGLSELERSARDRRPGKVFESSDELEGAPQPPTSPARGRVVRLDDGTEALTVFIHVEPFENGARPIIQLIFRADRPREVELRVHSAPGGAAMKSCILTATMGNFARLRNVWLRDEVVHASQVWPDFRADNWGFSPHETWPLDRLRIDGDEAIVAATTDEADPSKAEYDNDVARHWHYVGRPATQYWRAPVQDGLVARVNGRAVYWASKARIPGGVSFENFEMEAPFQAGQRFTFGVTLDPPTALGFERPKRDAE
jgi:hypothetical protein